MSRDLVILACAISAGIHGALTPAHFEESTGAGLGFVAAAALLAAIAAALTLRPASELALAGAATVLVGLLASYVFATTTGVPVLHPEPEPVGALALATKAVEAVGLIAIVAPHTRLKGMLRWTRHGPSAPSHSR
jgi:hypothetical protein